MWPDKVVRQFEAIPPNPSEADFHGPYNKLLYTLFPPESDFVVVPQYLPDSRNAASFIMMFEITLQNKPVLILELKPPSHLNLISQRQAADEQLRTQMADVAGQCPLDTLHGISALGKKLCFYSFNTKDINAEIVPVAIPRHPARVNDTAPADRWNLDVLESAGEQKLRDIVKEITDGCAVFH